MKSFKQHLLEYLTDDQRKKFTNTKMTNKARTDTDHFFGAGNDLIKEPLKSYDHDKSEVHKSVERHLGKDITTSDYTKGITQDKHGRDARIGRMISDKGLQTQFANDNTRAGTKQPQQHYTTTVRGTEVAGQTNSAPDANHPKGHSWGKQSCKNVDDGSNKHYLEPEIKHGTVVTRVHDHNDQEIYRATLQPHHNKEGHVAYALNSEYGVKHPSFTAHAKNVASRLSGEPEGSLLHKTHAEVYNDRVIKKILHPNATSEHIHTALKDEDWSVRMAAASHTNATPDHITTALKNIVSAVRKTAIQHPKATPEHITTALKDDNSDVRAAAIQHPKANVDHINKALGDNTIVRMAAIQHPKATPEHITTALKDEDWPVRRAAIQHPNATSAHIDTALKDSEAYVRQDAIKHHNVTASHISTALKDKDWSVRLSAIEHPAATSAHINTALKDDNTYVRWAAQEKLK